MSQPEMSLLGSFAFGFLSIIVAFAALGALGVIVLRLQIPMPRTDGMVPGLVMGGGVVITVFIFYAERYLK